MHTDSHQQLRDTWQPEPETDSAYSARLHNADRSGDAKHLSQREKKWLTRFQDAETFSVDHQLLPKEKSSDPVEASIAKWLSRQRTNLNRLCLYQIDLLNTLPFEWDPRDAHRTEQLNGYAEFVARQGRLPRRRSTDAAERALARWVGRR